MPRSDPSCSSGWRSPCSSRFCAAWLSRAHAPSARSRNSNASMPRAGAVWSMRHVRHRASVVKRARLRDSLSWRPAPGGPPGHDYPGETLVKPASAAFAPLGGGDAFRWTRQSSRPHHRQVNTAAFARREASRDGKVSRMHAHVCGRGSRARLQRQRSDAWCD